MSTDSHFGIRVWRCEDLPISLNPKYKPERKPESIGADASDNNIVVHCKCNPSPNHNWGCERAVRWIGLNFGNFDFSRYSEDYFRLQAFNENLNCIYKDVVRTFTRTYVYSLSSMQRRLSRVLNSIAAYFKDISYVQGMNFLVAGLLYHCDEAVAFWLMTALMEKY